MGGFSGSHIQQYVEAVKLLDRLAPKLAHRFIWEWIYAKQIALRDTKGAIGVLGGQTFRSPEKLSNSWTNWHQLWFTSADSSGNGHMLITSRSTIPQGGILEGFRGSHIQMSGDAVTNWHQMRIRLGMAKYNSPINTTWGISGGFRGSTI